MYFANRDTRPRYVNVVLRRPCCICTTFARPATFAGGVASLSLGLRGPIAAASLALVALCAPVALGQGAWFEGFEGPNPSWREAGGDMAYRIERHQRLRGEAHTGDQSELLSLRAEQGTAVYVDHDVGQPQIIDELRPSVWIKADRPGLQVLARVVLPRSFDPRSGRPAYVLIPGSSYRNTGNWQQLHVDDLSRLVVRYVRVLRSQLGPNIDDREAYLDRIVLNIYGGAGVTNVCIDDLDIAGYVARPQGAGEPVGGQVTAVRRDAAAAGTSERYAPAVAHPYPAILGRAAPPAKATLVGSVLLTEGRPFFPRIIQYQGEPLEFLSRVGFNTLWLAQPPSPDLMAEAERLHLWVVCPPPLPVGPASQPGAAAIPPIGPELDNVLAWDLGRRLSSEQLDAVRQRALELRAADRCRGRPLIVAAEAELRNYSRVTGLLLLGRQVLGASMEMSDYAAWLRSRQLLAEPGTPIWSVVQTQLPAALAEPLGALFPGRPVPLEVSSTQIRLMAYTALVAGSRGLLFESQSPLNATDPETRYRVMALELLNLDLALIEPWVAAAAPLTTVGSNVPEVSGTTLRSDHARLMIPLWSAPHSQYVLGQAAANTVALVAPGVPESFWANELIPGGLRTLRHNRVLGGYQVVMEEFGPVAQIAMTQDPLVLNTLTRQSLAAGQRAAELSRELATHEFQLVQRVAAEVSARAPVGKQSDQWLTAARRGLLECDERLTAKEYQAVYLAAQRAMRPMRLLQRAYWDAANKQLLSPAANPAAASFATLPWQWRLIDRVTMSQPGPNRMPGGDFEDLPNTLGAGWQHFPGRVAGVESLAELVPAARHSGQLGMHLAARPASPQNVPAGIETAPLWIASPPVPVDAGNLVRIHGWVNTVSPVTGSSDGLSIFDSIAGETLAERITQSFGWHEFTLFRIASRSGPVSVTFALNGLGDVYLDEVSVQVLEPLAGARLTVGQVPNLPR